MNLYPFKDMMTDVRPWPGRCKRVGRGARGIIACENSLALRGSHVTRSGLRKGLSLPFVGTFIKFWL